MILSSNRFSQQLNFSMYQLTHVNPPSNENNNPKNTETRDSTLFEDSNIELREVSKHDSGLISEIMNSVEKDIKNKKLNIKQLPEDILRQVFSFLDRESLFSTMMVNKQWYQASGKMIITKLTI